MESPGNLQSLHFLYFVYKWELLIFFVSLFNVNLPRLASPQKTIFCNQITFFLNFPRGRRGQIKLFSETFQTRDPKVKFVTNVNIFEFDGIFMTNNSGRVVSIKILEKLYSIYTSISVT